MGGGKRDPKIRAIKGAAEGEAMEELLFDGIVSGFYRAATGVITWNDALAPVSDLFQTRATLLHAFAPDGRLIALDAAGGPNLSAALLDYIEEYHAHDPRKQLVLRHGPSAMGKPFHCHEHLSEEFVEGNIFFRQFLAGHNSRYNSNIFFPIADQLNIALCLELPPARGPLTQDERHWFDRLGAHLHDALRTFERIRELMATALAGHQLLANHPYPMWLIDTLRAIVYQNPAGQAETTQARWVESKSGRLFLERGDKRLTQVLSDLNGTAHGTVRVIDLNGSWLHCATLMPLATLGAFGAHPLIVCTLITMDTVTELDCFALARVFGLTPAEARVASHLANGETAEQIATTLSVSVNTIRFHVRQVLLKLGANRVVDVVRLLRQGEALWSRPRPTA